MERFKKYAQLFLFYKIETLFNFFFTYPYLHGLERLYTISLLLYMWRPKSSSFCVWVIFGTFILDTMCLNIAFRFFAILFLSSRKWVLLILFGGPDISTIMTSNSYFLSLMITSIFGPAELLSSSYWCLLISTALAFKFVSPNTSL